MADTQYDQPLATASENQPVPTDDGLGDALIERFMKGVREQGWTIVCLGSARSMSCGKQIAREVGGDADRLVLLVAERPK